MAKYCRNPLPLLQYLMIKYILKMGTTTSLNQTIPKRMNTLYSRSIDFFFRKNLRLTNSITSGGFMAIGDLIQQEYQYQTKSLPKRYDWERAWRMFIIGSVMGFGHHYYYVYLDVLWPKRNMKTVIKKIGADQFLCSPLTLITFFYGMGYLENKTLAGSTKEVQNKFVPVYIGDWVFWPPVQFLNFYYVPTKYRVLYINFATMIFDVFLSLMKHFDHDYSSSSTASK